MLASSSSVLSALGTVVKAGEQGRLLVLRAQEMYFISFGGTSVLSKQAAAPPSGAPLSREALNKEQSHPSWVTWSTL